MLKGITVNTEGATVRELRELAEFLHRLADLQLDPVPPVVTLEQQLQHDQDRDLANPVKDAEKQDGLALIFGGNKDVPTFAAPPVPSTAAVAPVSIAQEVPPVTSAPLPPVVPPAPPAPTDAATRSPAGNVELDSDGIPHDLRIHNDGRTKKVDGTWKLRKGIDKHYAAGVLAELKSKPVLSPDDAAMVTLRPNGGQPPPPPPPPSPATSVVASPPPPPPVTNAGGISFKEFMSICVKLIIEKKVTQVQINEVCVQHGVAAITQLAIPAHEGKIPAVLLSIKKLAGVP